LKFLAEKGGFALRINRLVFERVGGKPEDRLNLTLLAEGPIPIDDSTTWASLLKQVLERMAGEGVSRAAYMVRPDHLEITTVEAQQIEVFNGQEFGNRTPPLVSVSFKKQPIDGVLDDLSEKTGVNIVLDSSISKEAGKLPITARFLNVPLDSVLRLCANMADLKVCEIDNVIFVTTPERAKALEKEQKELIRKRRIMFLRDRAKMEGEDPATIFEILRGKVLDSHSPEEAAQAYQNYFLCTGRAGLKVLMNDENTSIALQAAWETNLKPVERKVRGSDDRTDDTYDPTELAKFISFFKDRTRAPVPDWWATAVTDVDLMPSEHHSFSAAIKPRKPEGSKTDTRHFKATEDGDNIVCSADGRTLTFPKRMFEDAPFHSLDAFHNSFDSFIGFLHEDYSVVAADRANGGSSYPIACFKGKDGERNWNDKVWGAGRSFGGLNRNRVEMTEKNGTVYLFGIEAQGAYAEAFNMDTGRVQFRFCTSYWFHFSERWDLE